MFRRRQSRHAEEVVYFFRAGDAVKIGTTRNLERRRRSLATGSAEELQLLGSLPGGADLEQRLHERFERFHVRGEWFQADEEPLAAVRDLLPGPKPPQPDSPDLAPAAVCCSGLPAVG